ncbi:MAG: PLP-dependent aminotransferase family protein [Clostridia bacterium]|nr:PLP-dependent aminotransferase family protein [Clostridia bacterium]
MLLEFLHLDRNGRDALYLQLYRGIRDAVTGGQLTAGEKMPSIRRLSEDLKLSKTTVEAAYSQLVMEGYLVSVPQKGCYVAHLSPFSHQNPNENIGTVPQSAPAALRYRFSTDAVDPNAVPVALWQKHLRTALARTDVVTSYGNGPGEDELRSALAEYAYRVRGVRAHPSRIVVGAGLQSLLYLLSGILRERSRLIGLETPGFAQAERVFADCGLAVCQLTCDESGLCPDAPVDAGIRTVYLMPSGRPGSGAPMPMPRRTALLEWAKHTGGLIIEDDHNGELRYHGRPVPALQGFDDGNHVIYIGTFSKVLLPSVRLAYMVLPPALAQQYYARAQWYHPTASRIEQLALAEYIRRGDMDRQLRRLRKIYAAKGDLLLQLLRETFGDHVALVLQETALRVLLTLPGPMTAQQRADAAALRGVEVRPAPAYPGDRRILLGFSGIVYDDIAPAVHRLALAWPDVVVHTQTN